MLAASSSLKRRRRAFGSGCVGALPLPVALPPMLLALATEPGMVGLCVCGK